MRFPTSLLIPVVAFGCFIAISFHARLRNPYAINLSKNAPISLIEHTTIKSLINPSGLPADASSLSITVPRPRNQVGSVLPDAQVLLHFYHGFFSGPVLRLERAILNVLRPNRRLGISALESLPVPQEVWRRKEVLSSSLPEVGTKLFGSWQVVDRQLASPLTDDESYITVAFGKDRDLFMGVLRFHVSKSDLQGSKAGNGASMMQLRLSSMSVVTTNNAFVKTAVGWLGSFHALYANLLFRDAVAEVIASGQAHHGNTYSA